MKRKISIVVHIFVTLLIACTVLFAGCSTDGLRKPVVYTITYTDDQGAHKLSVKKNADYSLVEVPVRNGYNFMGLYDSEEGGNQYVSATGNSLAPFTDNKNIVLYPQFKAKQYTIILNYQGAPVTGSRQITVSYNSKISELPTNLHINHKTFVGWFTEANCKGVQISDKYGSIPLVSTVNDKNFNLNASVINLYAGFEIEKHTVTLCFDAGIKSEKVQVDYNTPIRNIIPEARKNGFAPIAWSKSRGGVVWNGNVTEDITLYAVEYAPVIELTDGKDKTFLVERAGANIVLPKPKKALSEFVCWADEDGKEFNKTAMPSSSIKLKAVWRNKIQFNSNGGSEADSISAIAGDSVTLPKPTKEGYTFAGWYNDNGVEFDSDVMPDDSVSLNAGWYKNTNYATNIIGSSEIKLNAGGIGTVHEKLYSFDLNELLGMNFQETPKDVQIKLSFKTRHNYAGTGNPFSSAKVYAGIKCYLMGSETPSSASTYHTQSFGSNAIIDKYQNRELKTEINLSTRYFYILFEIYKEYNSKLANPAVEIKDAVLVISYPDISKLYL